MNQLILPTMTVKEINLKYPACRDVFNRYGMGGCGGAFGPPEPIFFFAAAHHVPLQEMMQELEVAAQKESSSRVEETLAEKSMTRLFKLFILAGLGFTLTFGTLWGVIKLSEIAIYHSFSAPSYSGTQAHGHAQVFGWVGLFIMGVAYYAVTKFKNVPLKHFKLAYGSFYLMVIGILLRSIAQPLADQTFWGLLNILSGILELMSAFIFFGLMFRTFRLSDMKHEFYEKYIHTSIGWLAALVTMDLIILIWMFIHRLTIIPQFYDNIILHMEIFGFITNMILGFSLRILPNFMGLKQPNEKLANQAFVIYNLGVLWRCAALPFPILSSVMELVAIAQFVIALNIFTKPVATHQIQGVDNAYSWFIKTAYVWLAITGILVLGADIYKLVSAADIAHAYIGAYRHAITVGFITTLMLGVAYRILPIFNGTELYSNKLMRVSFWLILVGNFMRVFFQMGTLFLGKWSYAVMGSSGFLELIVLSLFSYNIVQTLRVTTTEFVKERVVNPQTRVAEILDVYPELKDSFISLGFKHLANTDKIPGFVTVKFAAQRHGLNVDHVIQMINQQIQTMESPVHA